ncbi:MAG: hypothetical protein JWM52_89 [Candidatus Saccharibacteria bacterium]|nr:hypothetical protein [Candidatus Saccharibacteria bacterium]
MDQIIAQIIGYVALLFIILSFQKNKRTTLLLIMLAGLLLFTIHYALLGAWTGSLANLIEAGVVFIAYKKETNTWAQKTWWLYLFIGLYIITGVFTTKSWIDVLPIIAQTFGAIAVWQIKARRIRFLMLLPRLLWFIYNLTVGSQAGVITEVLVTVSVLVGIARFDVIPRFSKKKQKVD